MLRVACRMSHVAVPSVPAAEETFPVAHVLAGLRHAESNDYNESADTQERV